MPDLKKFRKKPIEINAVELTEFNAEDIAKWARGRVIKETQGGYLMTQVHIPTLEGIMAADLGDYIIEGIAGEIYPCKPDIFAATYEEVAGN